MDWKLLCVWCMLFVTVCAQDSTLEVGAVGAAVVEACILKIHVSGIFSNDYHFLRYSAYAETMFGTTIEDEGSGGIWKISGEIFHEIISRTKDVSSYYPAIQQHFGIDWESVSYDDMNVPLFSALLYRLITTFHENRFITTVPISIDDQGLWWSRYIREGDELSSATFTTSIASLLTGCQQPHRDVVFLIDSSVTSTQAYLTNTKQFVSNVVTNLKIDSNPGATRIGIAQYSTSVNVVRYIRTANESEVLSSVSSLALLHGNRLTGSSVRSAAALFDTENGGAGSTSGIPQILVLITAGLSLDGVQDAEEQVLSKAVSIIAVGVTDDVTLNELTTIGSYPEQDHAFLLSNYSSQEVMEFVVSEQICNEPAFAPIGQEITGVISPGNFRKMFVTFTTSNTSSDPSASDSYARSAATIAQFSIKITTSSGTLTIYYSQTIESPNSALYDFKVEVLNPNSAITTSFTPDMNLVINGTRVTLYLTLECTSDVDVHFTLILGDENDSSSSSNSGVLGGLTEGEIAGIAFSCIIVFCAILVAILYCRYGKYKGPDKEHLIKISKMQRLMDSRAQEKRLGIEIRERLQSALRREDITDVASAMEDFRTLKLEDTTGDYLKGKRFLAVHECREGITKAMVVRNVKMLEKAIYTGKKMDYDPSLKMELVKAEILLQELKKIENLLKRLKNAMDLGDIEAVESITAELRAISGCDQAMIDRMLQMFCMKEDLELAMQHRDVGQLRLQIAKIKKAGFENDLAIEIKVATKMIKELEFVEKVKNDVMTLQQSKVSEIRSYSNPPPGVHEVMMSVYLLMNYHPSTLENWTSIQALMGRTGKESLRRMVAGLDISGIDLAHAKMAKGLLSRFGLSSIKEISEGLATFFVFAQAVICELEKLLPGEYALQDSPNIRNYHPRANAFHNGAISSGITPVV